MSPSLPALAFRVPKVRFFPSLLDARAAVWRGDNLYGEGCVDAGRWGRIVMTPSHNFTNYLFIGDWRAVHGGISGPSFHLLLISCLIKQQNTTRAEGGGR